MVGMGIHYPITGLIVLAGSIGLLKLFDFLAAQNAKGQPGKQRGQLFIHDKHFGKGL